MSDDKKEVVVPEKFQAIVKQIEEMSVLDLSELVHVLEDKFGVSAAAPVAMMAAGAAGAAAPEEAAAKTSFTVEITNAGAQKIAVIKTVKDMLGLGLKDAKDMVEKAPVKIKENVPKAEAEEMKKKLEEAGATVELK